MGLRFRTVTTQAAQQIIHRADTHNQDRLTRTPRGDHTEQSTDLDQALAGCNPDFPSPGSRGFLLYHTRRSEDRGRSALPQGKPRAEVGRLIAHLP